MIKTLRMEEIIGYVPKDKDDTYVIKGALEHLDSQPFKHYCICIFASLEEEPTYNYGCAIYYCFDFKGHLYVGNGEYESEVDFCPYCGFAASNLIEPSC